MPAMDCFDRCAMRVTLCLHRGLSLRGELDARRSPVFRFLLYDMLIVERLMDLVPFVLTGQLVIARGDFLCCHNIVFVRQRWVRLVTALCQQQAGDISLWPE